MASHAMLGNKLRRLRSRQGLTQVAMAGKLGISPSYLNLIEHNQRQLNRALLLKLAERFDVDLEAFTGREESRLLADLKEAAGDPLFRDLDLGEGGLSELVATAPDAGRALIRAWRAYRDASEDVRGLGERLAADPFIAESSHQLLTLLTSLRSFAEILHDNADLPEPRRRQFVAVMLDESEKLAAHTRELLAFVTGEGVRGLHRPESAGEEVVDAVDANRNHYPEIESAAESTRAALASGPLDQALATTLERGHGVRVECLAANGAEAPAAVFDEAGGRLLVPEFLSSGSRAFALARLLARLAHGDLLTDLARRAGLSGAAAEEQYRAALAGYFAGAVMMPYEAFREAAEELRHDLDLLGQRFGASFEQVCHRLVTLQRPGAEGVPFHLVKVDVAGNVRARFSASGLRIPRSGGLCPRWNVHRAFLNLGEIDRQVVRLHDGGAYFFVARALSKPTGGFRAQCDYVAVGLGCDASFARRLVYADGLVVEDPEIAEPVGVHCRLCAREGCRQRALPSLLRKAGGGSKWQT